LVLGKVDRIDGDARRELRNRHPNAVLVSALSGEGLPELVERVEDEFAKRLREVELLIPFDEGGRLAQLHEIAGDLKREDTAHGVRVTVRLPGPIAERFAPFALSGQLG
jgi:GTP-binding protein HflX